MLRWAWLTCQVLLHLWALLQEPGPSQGPSVQHGHVLVHHCLVGLVVVRPLKAVGVDPAGANKHSLHTSALPPRRSAGLRDFERGAQKHILIPKH